MTPHPFDPQPFQVIQRTETPEGPDLKLVNSLSGELADSILPEFTLGLSPFDDEHYGQVTIDNADALGLADLSARVDYALSLTEPTSGSGTHFTTIPAASLAPSPTYSFGIGPFAEGSKLWVQLRAESFGLRPGPYTAWQSVELDAPALFVVVGADSVVVGADLVIA